VTELSPRVFLDSNIWIYHFTQESNPIATIILESEEILVSTQVLGELYNVFTRKKIFTAHDTQKIVERLIEEYNPIEIASKHVKKAIEISLIYGFSYWDSLIVATSLLSDCSILYSEDMQHNQVIEISLKILNSFVLKNDFDLGCELTQTS